MSAGSAHAQIPTRIRGPTLDDLLVDAGRDDAVDVDRLRDVLERLLADALQHERRADASSGDGADDDLAALGRAGEARRDVGGGASGGKRPPLPRPGARVGRAVPRPARVVPLLGMDRREDPALVPVYA